MIIGGSLNYFGAPVLAAHAALRAGVGLLTLAVPRSILGPVATQVAESTYLPLPEAEWGTIGRDAAKTIVEALGRYTALQIGNGIGREKATASSWPALRLAAERPPRRAGWLPTQRRRRSGDGRGRSPIKCRSSSTPTGSTGSARSTLVGEAGGFAAVLTPHHGEFARLRQVERAASAPHHGGGARRRP